MMSRLSCKCCPHTDYCYVLIARRQGHTGLRCPVSARARKEAEKRNELSLTHLRSILSTLHDWPDKLS